MDHAKKPAKQGFAAFGFTKIDAKAHQQVIEKQVAEGAAFLRSRPHPPAH